MGRQSSKSRKQESYGKGKVTPVQIAFIVDRYLSDNNYSQSRSTFRNEASHLISKSPVQEAPKSLLSLSDILDEYIDLKEQKVILDQEKCRLEQEKFRMQTLLRGLQDVMNVYNASGSTAPPPPSVISSAGAKSVAFLPQIAGQPLYSTPAMMPTSRPSVSQINPSSFCTPTTNQPSVKRRKGSNDVPDAPITAKRSRGHLTTNHLATEGTKTISQSSNAVNNQENAPHFSAAQSSPRVRDGSPVQGSSVAKCLFNQQNGSPPTNLSVPKTPLPATSSQTKKSASPPEDSSTATSGNDVTPPQTSLLIALLSLRKQSEHNMRDHVKGRLDFDSSNTLMNSANPNSDGSSVSESDKEGDMFDLDLPNLDFLGGDFSLSELLVDFNFDGDFSCQPAMDTFSNSHSGSPHEPCTVDLGANQVVSELSSTVTEILSEKDMKTQGPESVTSVKSTTKCIKILSPSNEKSLKLHKGSGNQKTD
ncbi:hypothetical protein C3L33_12527, partial [Rhododendron williamsianum]